MGLTVKTSEKASIHHLGSHHISCWSICYCCSLECIIINSLAIHLMINCWMGVFIYWHHDNCLHHNYADIHVSPPKYIRWIENFTDWIRCFDGLFRLGLQSKVLVSLLIGKIFQKQYKCIIKSKGMIVLIIKQITVMVYKNIIENEVLS